MPIHVLTEDVVAQIAAGEVIERPSSVVKELMENSLDAGARNIRIEIRGDGRERLSISDDGHGIHTEEIETAFLRHATSKLRTLDDLERLLTLGFRGEALASIAAVSRVTLTTRHIDDKTGARVRFEGGVQKARQSVASPAGTSIVVENLFFNTPARLKFLKGETTEKRQIAAVITRYAMAYPAVRFILEQDGREVFRTHGTGQLGDVLTHALGLEHGKQMLEVNGDGSSPQSGGKIQVRGYTSAPSFNRADRSRITLFINGRWIQDSSLTYAVIQAYHTLLMNGRFPVAVLMIELPPEDVDVNVHPTKAEVRFCDGDSVFAAVQKAVRRSIIEQASVQGMALGRGSAVGGESKPAWSHSPYEDAQLDLNLDLESPGQHARKQYNAGEAVDPTAIPEGIGAPARPRTLPMLRVIGQVAASYIVAEGPAGLYLVDQHAAHERILYEQFMEAFEREGVIAQQTLAAQTLQLGTEEGHLLDENLDGLKVFGFDVEPFGANTYVIRAVPAILSDKEPVSVIQGILEDLSKGSKPGQERIEDKIVKRVCKNAAVKAGQILSLEQMQGLIRQLERAHSPLTCPHGRPTLIHLSSERLEREFGRIV
jgi:DNA mismatch repair protein MutL